MSSRKDFLAGVESPDPDVFFPSLRAMLDDLGIENHSLTNQQLEAAVVTFGNLFASSEMHPNDRHEVLFRFAKAGGLPWLAMLAAIRDEVARAPGEWDAE